MLRRPLVVVVDERAANGSRNGCQVNGARQVVEIAEGANLAGQALLHKGAHQRQRGTRHPVMIENKALEGKEQ